MTFDPQPFKHPAVWYGRELLDRPDWSVQLEASEVRELVDAAQDCRDRPLDEVAANDYCLPTLGPKLRRVQRDLEQGSGAAILRGLSLDAMPEEVAVRVFWGVALQIGTPLSQSASGERVFHVRDEGFQDGDSRARGPNTRKKLSFHTDRCDVIAFMCLRQAKSGGDNDLVSSPALYNEILERRPDLLAELLRPYYYQRHNVDLGNDLPYCRQPIFSFRDGHFAGSFLRVLIERAHASHEAARMTDLQREALDFLEAVAEEPKLRVRLRQEPGEILLLNNWVTFHRRTAFEDHAEPQRRRHILRIWLSVPNSRPINPLFADNYGETAAGALRGGMRASNQ